MWRGGQEELTEPYVDRYFADLPATVRVRSGWVLADTTEFFFPGRRSPQSTLDRARSLTGGRPRPLGAPAAGRPGGWLAQASP